MSELNLADLQRQAEGQMRKRHQRKNTRSGVPGMVPSHREGGSDPHAVPSPVWASRKVRILRKHKLKSRQEGEAKTFWLHCPRRQNSRKKKGLIILPQFFLCLIFPTWQGRCKLWIEKKLTLSRAVLGLVATHAARPTVPGSLTTIGGSVGEISARTRLRAQGWALDKQSYHESQIVCSTSTWSFDRWGKRALAMFLSLPEITPLLRSGANPEPRYADF